MGADGIIKPCNLDCRDNLCVHRVPIFAHLESEELIKISSLIKRKNYKAKETVFSMGQEMKGLYILRYGLLKMVRYSREGAEVIVETLHPGDFYGGDHFFQASRSKEEAIAVEESGICFIQESDLLEIIKKNPEIGIKIIQVLSSMHSDDRSLISILSEKDALKRMALFLLWQTEKDPHRMIFLTQEDLAKRISLTHETVSRKMKELREMGYVQMLGYGKIEIINREGLSFFVND
ncbi:MAG: Crp/Fnr family transcriptional regulator [Tissierellia bacterium]|nr:Crp/Fnr family transcriptional regulator [Tissierellia bacterium]